MTSTIRVTVWGENFHEHFEEDRAGMAERYPDGMHGAIAAGLRNLLGDRVEVRTATQDQPEHGLGDDVLDGTDVLTWWGHAKHAEVDDKVVALVTPRFWRHGLLVLHSGTSRRSHSLIGTTSRAAQLRRHRAVGLSPAPPRHSCHPHRDREQYIYGRPTSPARRMVFCPLLRGEVPVGCCGGGRGRILFAQALRLPLDTIRRPRCCQRGVWDHPTVSDSLRRCPVRPARVAGGWSPSRKPGDRLPSCRGVVRGGGQQQWRVRGPARRRAGEPGRMRPSLAKCGEVRGAPRPGSQRQDLSGAARSKC